MLAADDEFELQDLPCEDGRANAIREHLRIMHRYLNVLDASERAADKVTKLIDRRSSRHLLHANQLRKSAQSVVANIAEGFGRGTQGDRARLLRIARGEAEETIRHLSANYRTNRLAPSDYWSTRNLFVVIVKMLNGVLHAL